METQILVKTTQHNLTISAVMKNGLIWILLAILMMVFWMAGLAAGNAIFPSDLMKPSSEAQGNVVIMLFIICLLHTSVVLYYINNTRLHGYKLILVLFFVMFGIQYFMSQIETFWFNDSLKLPVDGIWALVSGGAIMSLLFSIAATWISGHLFKSENNVLFKPVKISIPSLVIRIMVLSVIVWPLVYFSAGYLIAWQFDAVRQFYTQSTTMESIIAIMKANFASGLYLFQILRGLLWVIIAFAVLGTSNGSIIKKGIILGLLLSLLGSGQLLLPNPYMNPEVRFAHLLETSSSSFLWGMILSWVLGKFTMNENSKQTKEILNHGK